MIEAALFDLGNVLIRWDPRLHYVDRFDNAEQMEWFLTHIAPSSWNHEMDMGKPFDQAIEERQALFPQHATLIAEWKSGWERMLGGAIEDSVDLLDRLRTRGYRVAALTNWSAETFPVALARYPFLGWFEDIIISGVDGVAKPESAAFQLALTRTGWEPARTVFIDDSLPNVAAAASLGMHSVHFASPAQCREELRALGVRV